MASEKKSDFEVDQDLEFQRRDWAFERTGWIGMLVVVLAALAGLMGHGPLSQARVASGDLTMEYSRFERHGAPSTLTVLVPRAAADTSVQLWLSRGFLDGILFDRVIPEAAEERAAPGGTIYDFLVTPGTDTARIIFHYTPLAIGTRSIQIGRAGRETVRRSQFVYP